MKPFRPVTDPLAAAIPEPAVAPLPEEAPLDVGEALGVGAESVLSGATAGLSNVFTRPQEKLGPTFDQYPAITELHRQEVEAERQKRERHPFAQGVGEFAGMLISPIGEVGKAITGGIKATTALGRIGAEVAGQAAVGSLYGAGNTLSDAALGDHELTAEKLIAGTGLGAILGAGGGLLGASLTEGAKAVLPSLSKSLEGAQGGLEEFANDRWLKATNALPGELKNVPPEARADVVNVLREHFQAPGEALPKGDLGEVLSSVAKEGEKSASDVLTQAGLGTAGGLLPGMDRDAARAAIETAHAAERSAMTAEVEKAAQAQLGMSGLGALTHDLDQEAALATLTKLENAEGPRVSNLLKQADQAGVSPSHSGFVQRFNDFAAGLNPAERDLVTPDIEQAQKWILELGANPAGSKKAGFEALNDLKSTIQSNAFLGPGEAVRSRLRRQVAHIIRDEIDSQLEGRMGGKFAEDFAKAKQTYGLLRRAEDALGRKTSTGADALDAIAKDLGVATPEFQRASANVANIEEASKVLRGKNATGADAIAALGKGAGLATPEAARFQTLQHAANLLQSGVERKLVNRFVSLSDYMTGIAAGLMRGDVAGVALGLGSAIGHKVLRERGSAIAATLADRIAASPALSAIATGFAQRLPQVVPQLGPYAAMLTQAATRGPQSALATHMTMAATDPGYQQAAQLAGLMPEDSQQHGAALVKAHGIAQIAASVQAHDRALDNAVSAMVKGEKGPTSSRTVHGSQDFGTKRMRRDEADAHAKRVEEVRMLATNPEALLERVSANLGNLHNVAPGVAASLAARANSAVQFLTQESQEPAKAGPLAPDWKPNEHERWAFSQKLQAIEDPMSVLRHAASGMLTQDQVRAIATVYPTLYRDLSDRIIRRVTEKPEGVAYGQRVMLSLFTGMDLDGTMSPQAVLANQKAISQESVKPSNQAPAPKSGDGDLTLAQRTATPNQRREMGQEA